MAGQYYNRVQEIFEESVVDALNLSGISIGTRADEAGKEFQKYNPIKIYLRETILNKLEFEYEYSAEFRNKIAYNPDNGDFNKDEVKKFVREYVQEEIRLETGRMQVDAERKILENAVEGQYFQKGGGKKFIENVTAIISPGSARFNKLLGTKLKTETQDQYRKAVLDVVFSRTADGLVSEIAKLDKLAGTVTRPEKSKVDATGRVVEVTPLKGGQTFSKAVVDILEPSSKESKVSSSLLSSAKRIKKEFEDLPALDASGNPIPALDSAGRPKLDAANQPIMLKASEKISNEIKALRERALFDSSARDQIYIKEQELRNLFETRQLSNGKSAKENLEEEQSRLRTSLVETSKSGLVAERRQHLFYGRGSSAVASVWESEPELKLKIKKYEDKRDSASNPLTRNHYQNLVDYYQDRLGESTSRVGNTVNAFTFYFADGEIVLNDTIRAGYDKANKDFAQGLKFLDYTSEYNILRIKHIDYDIQNIKNTYNYLNSLGVLTKEQQALLNDSKNLLRNFELNLQALNIVEGLGRLKSDDPKLSEWKTEFLANIDSYESDPVKKAAIISAINSNDRRALKRLISSGSGKTDYDLKHKEMYDEFERLGINAAEEWKRLNSRETTLSPEEKELLEQLKGFSIWTNKRTLDNQIIQSFVFRRNVDTVIYAAQLMTDSKYLKKEVKRLLVEEVKQRLTTNLLTLMPYNQKFTEFMPLFYEFSQQDNKLEWLKKEGTKKLVDTVKQTFGETVFFKQLQKNFEAIKLLGVELKMDIYSLAKDPLGYLKDRVWFLSKVKLEGALNYLFRGSVEKLFNTYVIVKTKLRSFLTFATEFSKSFLTKYGGAAGARLLGLAAGLSVPVVGWIFTAVLAVLPVLLKPLFGDVDILTMLKKVLKFVCLIPLGIFFAFWLLIIVPITTLFANVLNNFLDSVWITKFTDDVYKYSMEHDWTFGVNNEYELTYELANGLVTTTENSCLNNDGSPLYTGVISKWNNLTKEDFNGLSTNLNCKIMCNAQKFLLTLYPGVDGLLNCNASQEGQLLFSLNPGSSAALKKFWCTYSITKTYRDDFPELADDTRFALVANMDDWFESKSGSILAGDSFTYTNLQGCFDPTSVMPGSVVMMSTSQSCGITKSDNNHVALFLKFEDDKFWYINSNSGAIKEYVGVTRDGCFGGQVKLNQKVYTSYNEETKRKESIVFFMCKLYQPVTVPSVSDSGRCPTECIPNKLNY